MSGPAVTAVGAGYSGDEKPHSQLSPAEAHNSTDAHGDKQSHLNGLAIEATEKEEFSNVDEKEFESHKYSYEHKELSQDGISDILDMECGEPMTSQHLKIDFNPLEGVDDSEYLLKKCMNFWKLIDGSQTLQHLKALPEKSVVDSTKSTQSAEEKFLLHGDFPPPRLGAIEVMEDKGKAIDDCLVNKIQRRYCEEGCGDYFLDIPPSKSGLMTKWATPKRSGRQKHPTRAQREEVSKMCKELEQWDMNHPKSMDPPNHGPPHTYAVMQKN